jgi:hypothetical protein
MQSLPPEVRKMLQAVARPEYLDEQGRLVGRPFVSALFNGWRYVAIGARLTKVPPSTTFHEFLEMLVVSDVLGEDWVKAERDKLVDEQHPVARWLFDLRALRAGLPRPVAGEVREVDATGHALALLTLAYDAYDILHCAKLPERIVARLKHPNEFQGAKYELAVAGVFVRAGFTIEWIEDVTRKRPEFIATHKTTKERLVVEAKSRHRSGVLGRTGIPQVDVMKADLDRLLHSALEKESDGLPYAIYLDANLPPLGTLGAPPPWIGDVQRMIERRAASPAQPDPFVGITVTNYSWHYAGDTAIAGQSESLLVLPRYPRVPLRDERTMRLIFEAAQQYGHVPGTFPES